MFDGNLGIELAIGIDGWMRGCTRKRHRWMDGWVDDGQMGK